MVVVVAIKFRSNGYTYDRQTPDLSDAMCCRPADRNMNDHRQIIKHPDGKAIWKD